jgi:hypothetical protein
VACLIRQIALAPHAQPVSYLEDSEAVPVHSLEFLA